MSAVWGRLPGRQGCRPEPLLHDRGRPEWSLELVPHLSRAGPPTGARFDCKEQDSMSPLSLGRKSKTRPND